ncbi:MAG: MFS transporter [Candidatus Riflebacteria bacterium]|nr:MFS transporter [Candidatus Riflebacteria bacterium]
MTRNVLRAFASRNYTLFFCGQGLSLIGSFIQSTAFSWILYRLTGSPVLLGHLSALMQLPVLLLLPFAGTLADRFDRYRLLLITQTLFTVQSMGLAALAFTGHLGLEAVVAMGFLQGIVTALDGPPRLALIPRLVDDPGDLPAAISLNSAVFNAARSIGPPIAGFLMAEASESFCFLANGISYFFVIGGLILMRLPAEPAKDPRKKRGGLIDTLRYLKRHRELSEVLMTSSSIALVTMSVYVLMPVWARDILASGPRGLGYLMGGIGVGALIGAVVVGSRTGKREFELLLRAGGVVVGGALMLFSLTSTLYTCVPLCLILGFAFTSCMTSANTLLQLQVDDDRRAGVMSVCLLSNYGSVPVGNFVGGTLAGLIGPHGTSLVGGTLVLVVAVVFLVRALGKRDGAAPSGS